MKYKAGDEVLVKAKIKDMSYVDMMYVCELVTNPDVCIRFKSPTECIVSDKTYSDGLKDAWELAKRIAVDSKDGGIPCDGLKKMFNSYLSATILSKYTVEEALAKIEAYEKEKEIKVGDVVEDEEGTKALVIDEATENTCFVFTENGCVEDWYKMDLKKTGNKISIESLLRQIGE